MATSTNQWIDNHENEMVDFLEEYVSYRSATENEEEVQTEFIKPFFESNMMWDDVSSVDVSEEGNRPNINAHLRGNGDGSDKSLLLNGHSDVVDVTDEEIEQDWSKHPWEMSIENGDAYGRGVMDMKGPNTALIWAAKAIMQSDISLNGDLLLSLVVGEEFGQGREYGARPATQAFLDREIDIDLCIVAEGTNLEIHPKTSFLFDFSIEIDGKKTHSSNNGPINYPQRYDLSHGEEVGVDAGSLMVEVVDQLENLEHDWNMKYQDKIWGSGGYPVAMDSQGVGRISLSNCILEAGDYIAAVPGDARITSNVYGPPTIDPQELWEDIQDTVDGVATTHTWLQENPPKLRWKDEFDFPSVNTSLDHPGCKLLGESIEEITGDQPLYSGFVAVNDGSFIQNDCGVDVITYGPGHPSMGAHGADEHLPLDQFIEATKVYAKMITEWCGSG